MSARYSGDCDAVNYFQIDAKSTDNICDIQYTRGDISGISSSAAIPTTDTITGTWTIPSIHADCYSKTVYAYAAGLYDSGPPPTTGISFKDNTASPGSVTGSFTFVECYSNNITYGDANTNNDRSSQCPDAKKRCHIDTHTCIVPVPCSINADCIPGECCSRDSTLPESFKTPRGQCLAVGNTRTPAQPSYLCA